MTIQLHPAPLLLNLLLYFCNQASCIPLMAPLRCLRISDAASSGSIRANSIKAMATKTGALPNPATQCTGIVGMMLQELILE